MKSKKTKKISKKKSDKKINSKYALGGSLSDESLSLEQSTDNISSQKISKDFSNSKLNDESDFGAKILSSSEETEFLKRREQKKLRKPLMEFFKKNFDLSNKNNVKKPLKTNSKITSRFDEKKIKPRTIPQLLNDLSLKLGYDYSSREIHSKILKYSTYFCIFLSLIFLGFIIINQRSFEIFLTFLIAIWTLGFVVVHLLFMLFVFTYLDIRMYAYVKQIEEALPDFLQLASANISAGMTVDRALWYAVRPKFGILAKEMESVAKSTIAGEDLEKALLNFGNKYDSRILKETINLIVEGISSGGQMAQLLNKLSSNIKETQLMKKEISASVTTYAIFIGIATIVAAPILFALSTELLFIIQKIFSNIHIDKTVGVSSLFTFNFSGDSISIADFKKFAIVVLVISSFFSAAIISIIRKGSVKDGVKTIPLFAVISIVLYFVFVQMFSSLMGGLF